MTLGFNRLWHCVFLIGTIAPELLGQGKPPASEVAEPYRQKFVRYVDNRSMKEKALNLVGLTSQDVGRSFAVIAGVSKYPNMSETDKELPAAAADIDELQNYLTNEEFFDEIIVLREGDVTLDNLEYFLQDYFPQRLKQFPKSRFLFAYSGHGMAEGSKDNPTGYLLKNSARNFADKQNSINMSVLRVYLDQEIDAGYQTLVLINACYSGAFLSRRSFGAPTGQPKAGGIYFPKDGGAHAITAGGSNQLSWHDPKLGKGSVFFEKLLAGLGGQADTFPIHPDGSRGDGVITVDEIAAYLREEVSLATNQAQTPIPADLALNRSLGGFFFFNRQKMISNGIVSDWNPSHATSFGNAAEATMISAVEYYKSGNYQDALPLLRSAAEMGNAKAESYIGNMYRLGRGGLAKDDVQAVSWYRKAADAGSAAAMNNLGVAYQHGQGGLPKDDALALNWYRKAADAGDAVAMNNLGFAYQIGRGDLPTDDAQAVSWYRKAADAGSADGMNNLGIAYQRGQGGLPKDDAQSLSWYRKAADAGSAEGMYKLGVAYLIRQGGLPTDDAQAVSWYRKAADAGSADGMNSLGVAYQSGRGGLPKDEAQAVSWYRKAAALGHESAKENLKRLGIKP